MMHAFFARFSKPPVDPAAYEVLVGAAVRALRTGNTREIMKAVDALKILDTRELLAELCVWVEDVTVGRDLRTLLSAAQLPLPENVERIIDAVNRNSIRALHKYADGDLVKLIASMLTLVASFQEAGERI